MYKLIFLTKNNIEFAYTYYSNKEEAEKGKEKYKNFKTKIEEL